VRWIDDIRSQPGQLAIAAVVGLLVVVVLVGALELALHERVDSVTDRALQYDVRLEDQGDDLRLAVFNLDVQHRNLALGALRGKVLPTSRKPTTICKRR